jgi:CheY-like chemotaxis protein
MGVNLCTPPVQSAVLLPSEHTAIRNPTSILFRASGALFDPFRDLVAHMNAVPNMPRQLECILCVEDEEDIQSIVNLSLKRFGGMRVHFCTDPQEAMERAREVTPDLILLDFLMPGLDGATLFKRLQADPDLARIPVVFLTAIMRGNDYSRLAALGAAGIIFKPFDVQELPRKLAEIWNGVNTTPSGSAPERPQAPNHDTAGPIA